MFHVITMTQHQEPVTRKSIMLNTLKQPVASLAIAAFAPTAHAAKDEIYTKFLSSSGAGGYDVVAYFTEGKPVEGDSKYATEYKGADWQFSSQENLDIFNSDPDKYVPQYGGYCAWAVSQGYTASGDPLQWSVVNDKLYLNYDATIQSARCPGAEGRRPDGRATR